MFILKLFVKILIMPIIPILAIVNIIGILLTKVSAYVAGTVIMFLVVCLIVACIEKNGRNIAINIIFGAVAYGMVFAIAIFSELVKETNSKLIRFLAS